MSSLAGALTHLVLTQKAVLYLRIDTMEPLFGSVGSLLIGGDFCLKLRDPVFGLVLGTVRRMAFLIQIGTTEVSRRPDVTACQATAIKAAAPKGSPSIMAVKVCLHLPRNSALQ